MVRKICYGRKDCDMERVRRHNEGMFTPRIVSTYDPAKYARIEEVATILGVSQRTVRAWLSRGDLSYVRLLGRYILVPVEEIEGMYKKYRQRLMWRLERMMNAMEECESAAAALEKVRERMKTDKRRSNRYDKMFAALQEREADEDQAESEGLSVEGDR